MRQARQPANRMHQQWMLARLRDVMRGNAGVLGRSDYQAVTEELQRKQLLHGVVDYDAFVRPLAPEAARR